jgi:hypothetical protein
VNPTAARRSRPRSSSIGKEANRGAPWRRLSPSKHRRSLRYPKDSPALRRRHRRQSSVPLGGSGRLAQSPQSLAWSFSGLSRRTKMVNARPQRRQVRRCTGKYRVSSLRRATPERSASRADSNSNALSNSAPSRTSTSCHIQRPGRYVSRTSSLRFPTKVSSGSSTGGI